MSGMEPLLIGAMVAGSAASAVTGLAASRNSAYASQMAGQESSRAAEFENQQLKIQSETAKIAADQAEAKRRSELVSSLETIQAIRAGRGVGAGSPTGAAIYGGAIDDEERNIATERFNYLQKSDISRRAAEMASRKARTSLLAGDLTAQSELLSGYSRAASTIAGTAGAFLPSRRAAS